MIGAVCGARIGRGVVGGGVPWQDFAAWLVGSGGAEGTTITIPTHAAGDVVVLGARRGSNTPPTIPSAGGTVPTWTTAQSAGADTMSLTSVAAVATSGTHTSGTFTNAQRMVAAVVRGNRPLTLGASSSANATSTETIVYPALTRQTATGPGGVRIGTRAQVDSEVANAPTGWTARVNQSSSLALHTIASMTTNPTADAVTTAGTAAAYRAHTIEVKETA